MTITYSQATRNRLAFSQVKRLKFVVLRVKKTGKVQEAWILLPVTEMLKLALSFSEQHKKLTENRWPQIRFSISTALLWTRRKLHCCFLNVLLKSVSRVQAKEN